MSEYQYYEFLAIDRPLTKVETANLRKYSTRARITSTSFVNDYSWGGFKGNEDAWMQKYFDAFLYLANWGTHILKFRLSANAVDTRMIGQCCVSDRLSVDRHGNQLVLTFCSEDEDHEDWVEGPGQLSSLVPLRAEIAQGDHRALYLGWLLAAQSEELDDDDVEPPVPPGLGEPSAALEALIDFMRIDEDLIAVAAQESESLKQLKSGHADLLAWLKSLPGDDKDALLVRIMDGDAPATTGELRRRFRQDRRPVRSTKDAANRRTVGQLLDASRAQAAVRREIAAKKRAEADVKRKLEMELARKKYLDGMVGREKEIWEKVEKQIRLTQPTAYDEAIKLLKDLRDLADHAGDRHDFHGRLDRLRERHSNKPSLHERLRKAEL